METFDPLPMNQLAGLGKRLTDAKQYAIILGTNPSLATLLNY